MRPNDYIILVLGAVSTFLSFVLTNAAITGVTLPAWVALVAGASLPTISYVLNRLDTLGDSAPTKLLLDLPSSPGGSYQGPAATGPGPAQHQASASLRARV